MVSRGADRAAGVLRGPGGLAALVVAVTAVAVVALALLLGRQLEREVREEALASAERAGQVFASVSFQADEFEDGRLTREALDDLDRSVRRNDGVMGARVYTTPSQVLYGSSPPLARDSAPVAEVRRAFAGEITSEVTTLGAEATTDERSAPASGVEVVEVNLPLPPLGHSPTPAVVTVFLPYAPTRRAIERQTAGTRALVAGVAVLLLLVAIPLIVRLTRSLSGGRRHAGLQRELRRALARDELVVHYQPKVDLGTGAVVGTEALVRWQHPERGLLAPGAFIGAVEETELIGPLTVRVLDRALGQAARWRRDGVDLPPVAVNLSSCALTGPGLVDGLVRLIDEHGLSPADVVLEVTETAMMRQPHAAQAVLLELDRLGFALSIDDFGTGYSSLARLDQLPISELKIDRTFVSRIAAESTGRLVVTMIDLARDLGMRVVAEGVESQEVADRLVAAGCSVAQGYHFARPMAAEHLEAWHAARAVPVPVPAG